MKYIVVIRSIVDTEYRKVIGIRNTLKDAKSLEILMLGKINDDYYIDIEIQE